MATPYEMVMFVYKNGLENKFLTSMMKHKDGYSIGEIVDKEFVKTEKGYNFVSKGYKVNLPINDDDVLTAVMNGLYVSAFISRKDAQYNIHFLVHKYPITMKPDHEDEILNEVLRYMVLNTVVALKLDNKDKIRKYCG